MEFIETPNVEEIADIIETLKSFCEEE